MRLTLQKPHNRHAIQVPYSSKITHSPKDIFLSRIMVSIFYFIQGSSNVSISIQGTNFVIHPNSSVLYVHSYKLCSSKWRYEEIIVDHVDSLLYIKMCQPLTPPMHPVVTLLLLSIILVLIGSIYGQNHASFFGEESTERVDSKAALMFLFVSSAGLLSLYLFAEYLQVVLLVWVTIVGFVALTTLIIDIAQSLNFGVGTIIFLPWIGKTNCQQILAGAVAFVVVLTYLVTRNWMFSNFIAIALILLLFKLFEIDSMRTAAILLTLAFFYDIFWVFYSPLIFGKSVMATVATSIDLPMKLQCPEFLSHDYPVSRCSLIGLGDIILPGVLLKYLYKCDLALGITKLFPVGYAGYIFGLFTCMYCLIVYQMAQPALLYLVPSILIPVLYTAWKTDHFKTIWNGDQDTLNHQPKKLNQIDQDYELTAGQI